MTVEYHKEQVLNALLDWYYAKTRKVYEQFNLENVGIPLPLSAIQRKERELDACIYKWLEVKND